MEDHCGFMWGRRDGGMPDFPVVNLGHMKAPRSTVSPPPPCMSLHTHARRCMHGCANTQTDTHTHTCRTLEGWVDAVRAQTPWLNRFRKLNTLRQTHMYERRAHTDSPPPDNPVTHTKPLQPSLVTESCDGRGLDMTLVSVTNWNEGSCAATSI